MKAIYTDDETDLAMKNIRKIEPDFNFSKFFKEQILAYSGEKYVGEMEIESLKKKGAILKLNFEQLKEDVERNESIIKEASKRLIESKKQEKEKEEAQEEKKKDRIKTFSENIKLYFEIKDKKEIKKLAEEFDEINKSKKITLFDFMKKKGIKDKKLEEIGENEKP